MIPVRDKYDFYYLSYSSPKLPLTLVNPLSDEEVHNRNTCFGACVDDDGKVIVIHQLVYGAVELSHEYSYAPEGHLAWAEIRMPDEATRKLWFDDLGQVVRTEEYEEENV